MTVTAGSSALRQARDQVVQSLVRELAAGPTEGRERQIREQLIEAMVPDARAVARRYVRRGMPHDDLMQAACLGLVKAGRRFDVDKGNDFGAYAYVNMTGEVKRLFRDTGWDLRPTRGIQELWAQIKVAQPMLEQSLARSVRVSEIAAAVGVSVDDVVECLEARETCSLLSLDTPVQSEGPGRLVVGDAVADPVDGIGFVDDLLSLQSAFEALPEHVRRILQLRYWDDETQQAIADRVGVTQMQVSRLLTKAHRLLRERLLSDVDEGSAPDGVEKATRGAA